MNTQKLMPVTYYDPDNAIRLTAYADTAVWDDGPDPFLVALRLGGYPEVVHGLAAAICGGATIELGTDDHVLALRTRPRQYHRELNHDGLYAEATLILEDDRQGTARDKGWPCAELPPEEDGDVPDQAALARELPPRNLSLFCTPGNRQALFEAIDQKTAVPLIPAFQAYVLDELERRGYLRRLQVCSLSQPLEAWTLRCENQDKNLVAVLEDGLKKGTITIPGAAPGITPLDQLTTVPRYLNTFGITVAQRIKNLFLPLYDPERDPLSPEVLAINDFVRTHTGYSLYDAQLAVAEAIKRRLHISKVGLIVAECGTGKSKIGAAAIGASAAAQAAGERKAFHLVLCPAHVTDKWVREIEETVPNSFASVVQTIGALDRLYQRFTLGTRSCFAVISKERARDGYMRAPAVCYRPWNREARDMNLSSRQGVFCCPECGAVITTREGGLRIPADSLFFRRENRENHRCEACGASLWTALNPDAWRKQTSWGKIGGYGFVYRPLLHQHLGQSNSTFLAQKLQELADHADTPYPVRGAHRSYPLSTYIKRKYQGKIYGLIIDELHNFNHDSGQGDAMAELFSVAKKVVGMTATLINGYSSGLFHLLYRIMPHQMKRDGKAYGAPGRFDAEYGVVQNIYEERAGEYHANRRTLRTKKGTRLLPGVSPLVYSRFLLEYAAFLNLNDLGKDLPEYEEIPVPLAMPQPVSQAYEQMENTLKTILKTDRKVARKLLSAYLNLLTAYPDQPYGQPAVCHPLTGDPVVEPPDTVSPGTLLPKDKEILNLAAQKLAAGEKVLIYTNWTRLDTQKRLLELLTQQGIRAAILPAKVRPALREQWVADRLDQGLQILIANPSLIETGLDLNAFTTLIFYDTGYRLFTMRQASRRSLRVNQTARRIEVYFFYYAHTMQHKAIKLMANKLAVAGVIEGCFSEEGLAAMSQCEDLTTLMARELMQGIRDSVEDLAATFRRMAIRRPCSAAEDLFPAVLTARDETPLRVEQPQSPLVEFSYVVPPPQPSIQLLPPPAVRSKLAPRQAEQLYLFQIA